MRASIRILAGLLISLMLCSCASTPQLKLLEERAEYDTDLPTQVGPEGFLTEKGKKVPVRVKSSVVVGWLHPHEMPSGDYFLGGWVSLVIDKARWDLKRASPTN